VFANRAERRSTVGYQNPTVDPTVLMRAYPQSYSKKLSYRDLFCLLEKPATAAQEKYQEFVFFGKTKGNVCFVFVKHPSPTESLICSIRNKDSTLFASLRERVCLNQVNHSRSDNLHMDVCSVCWVVFTYKKCLYLFFKMKSNFFGGGVLYHSGLVKLNIIERGGVW